MVRPRTVFAPLRSFLLVTLLSFLAITVQGQSGRRASKPGQPSPQAPPLTEGPTNSPHSRAKVNSKPEPAVKLLVFRQSTSKHLLSEDTIYASFIKRLNEFPNIQGTSIGEAKRQQAILRSRQETESFVILLQFEIDNFQEGRLVLNSPDLEVKYFVFAPVTGQLKTKGKVYYQAIGGAKMRKDNWPNGPPVKITVEAAGVEAAERIHDWLWVTATSHLKK
jgi:hypothetical protein